MTEAKKLVPIQIAEVGSWKGHPSGPFELTPSLFSQIVSNFNRDGVLVPIDSEHASEQAPTEGSIPAMGAPAMGWIHSLENRGDGGLWGMVEWLEPARTYIKEGRYRYLSPAIRFNSKDRVTGNSIGARLTSAAITNQPFLKSMKALVARDRGSAHAMVALMKDGTVRDVDVAAERVELRSAFVAKAADYMPRVRAALRMGDLSSAAECSDMLSRLRAYCSEAGHEGSHEGIDLGSYSRALAEMVGGGTGTTWEQVFDVVEDLIDAAIDQHEIAYHGDAGGEDDSEPDYAATMADETNEEDEAMGETLNEVTAKLTDTTAKLGEAKATLAALTDRATAAEVKLSAAETQVSTLTLKLNEADTRASKAEGELKELRDADAARAKAAIDAEVGAAFDFYKEERKLTDAMRPHMLRMATADIEAFRGVYPPVAPQHVHLGANLTDNRKVAGRHLNSPNFAPPPEAEAAILSGESFLQTTKRLMSEKKLPHAEAQNLAERMRRAAGC